MRSFSMFFALAVIPLGACTIFSGGDDSSSGVTASDTDAGPSEHDSGRRDSGSHPSGHDAGSSSTTTSGDGGASTTRKDGGSSSSGGENCAALESCCETMESSSGCESLVTAGNESSCASALTSYQSGGYCNGGTNCATLSSCCAQLPAGPGWADTCNQEVGIGNDTECGSLYGTYQNDGYCTGNPGGLSDNCYSLSGCCEFLSGTDLTNCNSYVSANVDGTCESALTSYEDEGFCE